MLSASQVSKAQRDDSWVPDDDATLVFVLQADHLLLIHKKRGLGAGKISGPGGRIEAGETAAAAAARELEEELCVRPVTLERVGKLQFQFADGYGLQCTVFTSRGCIGTPQETDEAIPLWTHVSAIPFDRMWEDDRVWLPLMLAGKRFYGCALFDGDRMIDHDIAEVETVP